MITCLGLLTALEIILSRFFSINTWNLKIGFNFVPIVLAAMLFGPVPAGVVAALGDFLGAILFPIGAYFPGFTLTAFATGYVFGFLLYRKQSQMRILLAITVNQLLFSLIINSFWISVLYGSPYFPLLFSRVFQCVILGSVQLIVITLLSKVLLREGIKKVME